MSFNNDGKIAFLDGNGNPVNFVRFSGGGIYLGSGSDVIWAESYIRHDGNGITDANNNQVLGDQVTDTDLGNTPNTGDAATDDLIKALVNVITSHGLGST